MNSSFFLLFLLVSAGHILTEEIENAPGSDTDSNSLTLKCLDGSFLQDGRCCAFCPPGSGIVSFCDNNNDTVCETCPKGLAFSPKREHTEECRLCTKCGINEYARTPCNQTQDTVCECFPGFYRDASGLCKECTKCPVGWGAAPACTPTRNTVCVVCPEGSYSSVESASKGCQMCSECGPDEFSLQHCTSHHDSVCFRVNPKSETPSPVTEATCRGEDCSIPKDQSYLYTAPLYCAVLGAIVLGLLIYVVIRCRVNKQRHAQTILPKQQYQIIQQVPHYSYMYKQHHSAYPIVYLQHSGHTVTTTTKYRDVPAPIRKSISRSLANDGSWLSLAHHLGFTPSETSIIQQRVESDSKISSAASLVLTEWTKREGSSVGVISHALACINRLDLVTLLHNGVATV